MKNNNQHTDSAISKEMIRVDFLKLFWRLVSYWWLFLLCFIIAIASAKFYLRYAEFQYSARAILLIKDAGQSGDISAANILSASEGGRGTKAMDNEIQILKSLTLMEKVVERLHLEVAYYRIGKLKEAELYMDSPFVLDSFQLNPNNIFGATFFLELKDYESFLLKNSEDDPGVRCYYGLPFENENGRFVISLSPKNAIVKGDYRMTIRTKESRANTYKFRLLIERIGNQFSSSVLELKIVDEVPQRASDILNTLIEIYNEEEIKDENKILDNTLLFIDNRVVDLVNELDSVEGGIQRFKSDNEIINENASSSMNYTLGEIRTALQEISNLEIQKNKLQSLERFLVKDNTSYDLIPANLIAENPALGALVNQYNSLVIRHKQISVTASERNPSRIALEGQVTDLRKLILETIQNLRKDIQIPIKEIEQNLQKLRRSMSSIPGIEKRLVEKMRTQQVKEQLFLFLLQKREETALSEAVTTAKTRTIDRARTPKFPIYPKPKLILMASAVIGLLAPLLIVLLLTLLETKVDSEETIKQLTGIPIMGRIAFKKGTENIVVKHGSRSAINEMFRLLRTNLNFINHNKSKQTIMLTSSISGEGKTFIALNLGITLSLSGKKVILLGLDLRKPKLAKYLGVEQGKGVTNYLVGQSSVDDVIKNYEGHPNLFYITSGPTPPNPAELILSEKMETLLEELTQKYDYVLIDTPPLGLVSDALLLRKYVDNIFIVVRQNMTRKVMLRNLENMHQNKELEKASIIFNGVKKGKRYYGYGGYYYGKDQSYYVEE